MQHSAEHYWTQYVKSNVPYLVLCCKLVYLLRSSYVPQYLGWPGQGSTWSGTSDQDRDCTCTGLRDYIYGKVLNVRDDSDNVLHSLYVSLRQLKFSDVL